MNNFHDDDFEASYSRWLEGHVQIYDREIFVDARVISRSNTPRND